MTQTSLQFKWVLGIPQHETVSSLREDPYLVCYLNVLNCQNHIIMLSRYLLTK